MDKSLVSLEYSFLFDPSETWQHLHQFEADLQKFFNGIGLEARVIKTVGGEPGRRILYITKKEVVIEGTEKPQKGRPLTIKGRIKRLAERKPRSAEKKFKEGRKLKGLFRGRG